MKRTGLASVVVAATLLAFGTTGCARRLASSLDAAGMPVLSAAREYEVPWANAFPNDVALDSVGRVWFTDRVTHAIGMFDPATEEFRRYPTPTANSAPYGIIAARDGGLWYAGSRGGLLGRVDPATGGIVEHRLPDVGQGPQLLAWRDGQIWFTLRDRRGYGRFDPATGESTVYMLESQRPYSVAVTADAVWMSGYGTFRLLEIDPANGHAHVHDLTTATWPDTARAASPEGQRPQRILPGQAHRLAVDAAGALWFTDLARSRVIRYDAAAGTLRAWTELEQQTEPYGIAVTARGQVIYAEKQPGRVTLLDPVLDARVRVPLASTSAVRSIAVDERRGRIWLPMSDVGRLALVEFR
jgi:virginiamycin B lyase